MDINRKTAYLTLLDIEKNKAYSNLSLKNNIGQQKPQNQPFVREIVYGVLKNKLLLDYYLSPFIRSGLTKLKKQDITLLRMGAYQLIYMNSVPHYAAVNETVALARYFAKGRERFINGVLRNLSKKIDDNCLPPLPDRNADFIKYSSVRYSVNPWIVKLWEDAYGQERAEKILSASNDIPGLSIRVNTLKNTPDELKDKLERQGFQVRFSEHTSRGLIVNGTGVLDTELFKEGMFSVQDEASIIASDILGAKPGDLVIDVCAAPGGKTFATAEMMKNRGKIISMDKYMHKLEMMQKEAEKNKMDIVHTICHDSTTAIGDFEEKADRVLADVPCSGLGVLRRKPEIKYKSDEEMKELIARQGQILAASARYVRPGGVLVYSTCTINPEENERQIEKFTGNNTDYTVEKTINLFPTEGTDGFFICRMIKK